MRTIVRKALPGYAGFESLGGTGQGFPDYLEPAAKTASISLLQQVGHSGSQVVHKGRVAPGTVAAETPFMAATPDVSAILPFADDEEVLGAAARRAANHLREYGVTFELLAVDEGSSDNSRAVLALLRGQIPELATVAARERGCGMRAGASRARGHVLWLIEPAVAAHSPLAPFGRAYRRVARGEFDVVVVKRRFALCHRTRTLPLFEGLRGGPSFAASLAKRARTRALTVETQVFGGPPRPLRVPRAGRPWAARLLGALAGTRWV